jgi:hypothetical protein
VQTTVGRVMVSVNDFPRLGQSGDAGSTLHECSQIRHLSVLHNQRDVLRSVEASWLQEAGDGFLRSLVREPGVLVGGARSVKAGRDTHKEPIEFVC